MSTQYSFSITRKFLRRSTVIHIESGYACEDDDSIKVSVGVVSIHCNKHKLTKVKKPFSSNALLGMC